MLSCVLFGYILDTLFEMDPDKKHYFKSIYLWLIVDSIIILFKRSYLDLTMYLMINDEIARNIHTVYQIQYKELFKQKTRKLIREKLWEQIKEIK